MDGTTPPYFDVILDEPHGYNAIFLAEVLASFKKIPFQDAATFTHHAWGVAETHLSHEEAITLTAKLSEKKLKSLLIPSGSFKVLPAFKKGTNLVLNSDAMEIILEKSSQEVIQGDNVLLLAVGGIPERTQITKKISEGPSGAARAVSAGIFMTTGIPISIGGKKKKEEKIETKEETLFYLDVFTKNPLSRYRLDPQHLNYSFLKEKKLYNTFQNFKLLLHELSALAPRSYQNKGMRNLLANQSLSTMGYDTLEDFEKEMRWLITLVG